MNWLRKGFVGLLSIILLITLVGIASTANLVHNLSQPNKLEAWLHDSKLYDHVVASALDQSKNSDNSGGSGSISPSDPEVSQAAVDAFSPQLIEQGVNTFLNSNYAWLSGKTDKPDFVIDLSDAKQQFAKRVGDAAYKHLASIPVCTSAQLEQIQLPANPLTVNCRPAELSPQTESARVAEEISNNDFLSKPVITASNLSQGEQGGSSKPYYEKLSVAPKAYRLALFAPLILSVLAPLLALGIVFMSRDRRKGVRRVGIIILEAGIILLATKFVADFSVNRLQAKLLNDPSLSQLKQPLSDFIHQVESQLVQFNLLFGILFVVLAVVIFVILFRAKAQKPKPRNAASQLDNAVAANEPAPSQDTLPAPRSRSPQPSSSQPASDLADRLKPRSPAKPTGPPSLGKNPPRRKPPRLVQ
ncbi:MAG: hypothetical protein AAB971_00555 [Patescibacteria group bacterium]